MVIDAHVHVGDWAHADFLGRGCQLADAMSVMNMAGVAGAAILPTDRCDNAGLLREAQQVATSPSAPKLWMFAWVRPVTVAEGMSDLAWVEAHAAQLTGIKIHPSLSRVRVNDPGFAPALEVAERHGLVVLVHCGRWQEIASYQFAIATAAERPQLRFLLAHAGGDTPPLATAAADLVVSKGLDNVWFDFAGLREYWVIERNIRRLGHTRYLMGSDYSLAHPLMYIGAVNGMQLTDDQRACILGGNAASLFGAPLGGAP